jgi:imidazolonepropionase
MADITAQHPMEVVPTFMGAHAIPPEFAGRSGEFVDFIIADVLPEVAQRKLARYCDVFCEKGVFSIEESRRLLHAAQRLGLVSKLHADEIVPLGGAELSVELEAVSSDHLLHISDKGIAQMAQSGTVATLLPATAFSLREPYAPGRGLIDAGAAVALATDFNPGSCFTASIPLVIALAALYMKLSPAEIVTALTLNAAAAVGEAHRLGSIEPGKQADIVLLEYPSHVYLPYNIGMNCVATVIKKGQVVWTKEKGITYGEYRQYD